MIDGLAEWLEGGECEKLNNGQVRVNMLKLLNRFPVMQSLLTENYSTATFNQLGNTKLCFDSLPLMTHTKTVPSLASIGKLVQFEGVVVRMGAVRMRVSGCQFVCDQCASVYTATADERQGGLIPKPLICQSCRHTKFTAINGSEVNEDVQEVRVQEMLASQPGAIPKSVVCGLRGPLVDACQPGDHVIICGLVMTRWPVVTKKTRTAVCDFYILVHSVLVVGRNTIVHRNIQSSTDQSVDPVLLFSPELYGLYPLKLAILLTMISAGPNTEDSSKTRQNGHLLILGDPGTGKSHLLQAAHRLLTKRSVMVSGTAVSQAGLGATAVREPTGWSLEPGALVMADGGVLFIDEFDGLGRDSMDVLHEALEQQSVSIAKAGMVCTLQTRCSLIACANDYAVGEDLLSSPLCSRFDLIFVLKDSFKANDDCVRLDGVFKNHHVMANQLIDHVQRAKSIVVTECDPHAQSLISMYYQHQRKQDIRAMARTTIRLLESLIRLSRAHARLCLRDRVCVLDAIAAIRLMELSMQSRPVWSIDGDVGLWADRLYPCEYEVYSEEVSKRLGI